MDITNLISELSNNTEGLNMDGLNANNISSLIGGRGCSNNNNLIILIFLLFCCCNKGGFGQGNQGNTVCLESCCKPKKRKFKCCEEPERLICRPADCCNNGGFGGFGGLGGFGGNWCWIIILILILCSGRGNSICRDKC